MRVTDKKRNLNYGAESRAFYGDAGYYPEFGHIVSIFNDSGYWGALVHFENPTERQTKDANMMFDELENA